MTPVSDELRKRREEIVRHHIDVEETGDVEGTIATFAPGRASYDVPVFGKEMRDDDLRAFLNGYLGSMSDIKVDILNLHHADDAVIVEVNASMTHTGEYQGLAPTGRRVSIRQCAVFRFDGEDLWQETGYFDSESWLAQMR